MPKWAVAVGAVALVALLVAAGIWATRAESEPAAGTGPSASPTQASPTRPPTPTPTPTPEIILWAGEVCAARDALIASVVDVAGSLEYDPEDPASIGEQFQQQIPGQLDGVEAAADELGTALGGIPIDYVDAAVAIPVLQERLDALGVAKDEAMGHVDAAQGAGDPVSAGLEWLRAAAAAKATYDAGVLVKDSLGQLFDTADGDIR
ncbi:MAG: hypothetical protein RLZ94_2263, partial [Actinomycetota bacterium]